MTERAAARERAIAQAVREYWPGARFTYRDVWEAANEDRNVRVSMSAVHLSIRDAIAKGILERVPDTRPILFQWAPRTYELGAI